MTTLPGLLFIDWYDSAIGQLYGVDGVVAVNDRIGEVMWGVPYFVRPGLIGFVLALPLTALTLWRAGLVRWWALVAGARGLRRVHPVERHVVGLRGHDRSASRCSPWLSTGPRAADTPTEAPPRDRVGASVACC